MPKTVMSFVTNLDQPTKEHTNQRTSTVTKSTHRRRLWINQPKNIATKEHQQFQQAPIKDKSGSTNQRTTSTVSTSNHRRFVPLPKFNKS
jgi:hypothetical protein